MSGGDRVLMRGPRTIPRTGETFIAEAYAIPCETLGLVITDSIEYPGLFNLLHFGTGGMVLGRIPSLQEAHTLAAQIGDWTDWTQEHSVSERQELRDRVNVEFPHYVPHTPRVGYLPTLNRPEDAGRVLEA